MDLTRSYPVKDLFLQDIARVEYIPLETKDSFLVTGYLRPQYMDDDMLVTHNNRDIMIFDRKTGKAIRSFSHYGSGPGEYTGIHTLAVDKENNEMFATTNILSSDIHPIHVYDLEGKYLRTLRYRNIGFPQFFHPFDNDYLFWYNADITEAAPYKLISKTDTVSIYLPVRFTGRDNMSVSETKETGTLTHSRNGSAVLKTPEGYIFSEAGLDTLYAWNRAGKKLSPLMTRIPSFRSMKFPVGVFINGQSSGYYFLSAIERKFDFQTNEGFKTVKFIYDKAEGCFYEGIIRNKDYTDHREMALSSQVSVPAGQFVAGLQAWELIELYKNGRLQGELAEIALRLDESDNPVLMIVTFD